MKDLLIAFLEAVLVTAVVVSAVFLALFFFLRG